MTPEQAKAICIQAHQGQWSRPINIDYFQLECLKMIILWRNHNEPTKNNNDNSSRCILLYCD